jgi:hypothetical protein
MSRVSAGLEKFLLEQAAIRSPPTPPSQPIQKVQQHHDIYSTPQKQYGNMVNGYLTPPITPEGEYFVSGNEIKGYQQVPRCPVTPTPQHQNPYGYQQQYQSYQHENMMH